MLSFDSSAGGRRAHTARRLADVRSLTRPTMVKALVGLGLATTTVAAVALPVQARSADVELTAASSALVARDRAAATAATDGVVSRSSGRSAVSSRVAVTAPAAAESTKVSAGVVGVRAVAKPKPKPTPKPAPEATTTKAPAAPEGAEAGARDSGSTRTSDRTPKASTSRESDTSSSGSGSDTAYAGAASQLGLGPSASRVYSAVRSEFGISNIGGYRAGDSGDHGAGRAVDVMVSGSTGDAVAQWAIANMGRYNISYVIWKQRIWLSGASGWRSMEDRGSVTANHYDHVHISVN